MPLSFSLSDRRTLFLVDVGCAWHLSTAKWIGKLVLKTRLQNPKLHMEAWELYPFHNLLHDWIHIDSRHFMTGFLQHSIRVPRKTHKSFAHPALFWASSIISSVTSLMVCPASKCNEYVIKNKAMKVCWLYRMGWKVMIFVQCDIWRKSLELFWAKRLRPRMG